MNEIDTTTEGFVDGLPLCDRKRYFAMTDRQAVDEYLQLTKGQFGRVHGGNAYRALKFVARVLLSRGITQIPNIFGPIEVRA